MPVRQNGAASPEINRTFQKTRTQEEKIMVLRQTPNRPLPTPAVGVRFHGMTV